jgi:hypothetical protein
MRLSVVRRETLGARDTPSIGESKSSMRKRFERSPANERRRASNVSKVPFTSESRRLSTKAVNVTRIETTSRT